MKAVLSLSRLLAIAVCLCFSWAAQAQSEGRPSQDRVIFASNEHVKLASRYYEQALRSPEHESRQYMNTALEEAVYALRIYPDNAKAHGLIGLIYMVLKENDKAEAAFSRALRLTPEESELNNNYGLFLCESGKPRQSIEYFLKALRNPLYETPDIAYTNAGRCALRAGDLVGAERYLDLALQRSVDGGVLAKIQLAKVYYRRGEYEKSRVYLNDVVKRFDSPTPEALLLGIRLENKLGNHVEARSYEQRLRNRYPNSQEYQDFLNGKFED